MRGSSTISNGFGGVLSAQPCFKGDGTGFLLIPSFHGDEMKGFWQNFNIKTQRSNNTASHISRHFSASRTVEW
jgi:hypothetical protein